MAPPRSSKVEPCPPGYHLPEYSPEDFDAARDCVLVDGSQNPPGGTVEESPSNETWISTAHAAVAEMQLLAQTPEEKDLANRDRILVEKAAALVALRSATLKQGRKFDEAQMSFNLQYLQLQSQMQHENRSYAAISNIMKTKHDTVRNSLSNIR